MKKKRIYILGRGKGEEKEEKRAVKQEKKKDDDPIDEAIVKAHGYHLMVVWPAPASSCLSQQRYMNAPQGVVVGGNTVQGWG